MTKVKLDSTRRSVSESEEETDHLTPPRRKSQDEADPAVLVVSPRPVIRRVESGRSRRKSPNEKRISHRGKNSDDNSSDFSDKEESKKRKRRKSSRK